MKTTDVWNDRIFVRSMQQLRPTHAHQPYLPRAVATRVEYNTPIKQPDRFITLRPNYGAGYQSLRENLANLKNHYSDSPIINDLNLSQYMAKDQNTLNQLIDCRLSLQSIHDNIMRKARISLNDKVLGMEIQRLISDLRQFTQDVFKTDLRA